MKKSVSWLKKLSLIQKSLFGFGLIIVLAIIGGSGTKNPNLKPTSTLRSDSAQTQVKPQAAPQPNITTKNEIETQAVPYSSTTVSSSSLPSGQTKITTAGVNGSETLTYTVTYTNGVQTSKQLANTVVTIPPVTQVTTVGTYVAPAPTPAPEPTPSCTNGTYVNSAGNTVCSPEAAPIAPAGATAKCVDGTYSFSQSRSGTCSHHGGVASWL